MGGGSELFREGGAALYLVDDESSVLLQRGDFVVNLVQHVSSPLAAVIAMVGDMQWLLGKDSLVAKLRDGGFYFSNLPAELKFSVSWDNLKTAVTQKLETLLDEYSTYVQSASVQTAGEFWTRQANVGGCDLAESRWSGSSVTEGMATESQGGQRLAHRMQQAWRMSAVVKLLARSVERGAINSSMHVEKECHSGCAGAESRSELMVASVDAIAKVMEAVESAGRTLLKSNRVRPAETSSETDPPVATPFIQQRAASRPPHQEGAPPQEAEAVTKMIKASASRCWTLNKVGMRMLFATIVATMNRSGSSGSLHSTPCHSSDQPMCVGSDSAGSDAAAAAAASRRRSSSITSGLGSHAVPVSSQQEAQRSGSQPGTQASIPAPLQGGAALPAWMTREINCKSSDDLHINGCRGESRELNQSRQNKSSTRHGLSAEAASACQIRPAPLPFSFYGPSAVPQGHSYRTGPLTSAAPVILPAAAIGGSVRSNSPGFRVYRPQAVQPFSEQVTIMPPPSAHPRAGFPRPPHPRPPHF